MSLDFLINDKLYELQANNQLSVILSQFDATFGLNIIEDTMEQRLNSFDIMPSPNIVLSFEDNFKLLYNNYPNEHNNIDDSRQEVYREIIKLICSKFNLEFDEQQGVDIYLIAYYLYDFFVSRFNNYLVTFYTSYIEKEKDYLYGIFKLGENRKPKESSKNTAKYNYSDETLAVIANNITEVLSGMRYLSIPDHVVYEIIYNNINIIELISTNIYPRTPLFAIFNSILFNEQLYPTIITHIRMNLQLSLTQHA